MRCEIEQCSFITDHTNTYERDDIIMTRHLRAHTVMELQGIRALLSDALRSPYGGADGPLAPGAVSLGTPAHGGPLTGSTEPLGAIESGIRPMRQKGTG